MCFEVSDITVARDAMRERGATVLLGTGRALYRCPWRAGHLRPPPPKDTGGVLIELMQAPGKGGH